MFEQPWQIFLMVLDEGFVSLVLGELGGITELFGFWMLVVVLLEQTILVARC